MRGTHI